MNCQISLSDRIKALQGEIEYDQARVETDDDRRFLRAKLDELESLIAQAEAAAASKSAKPKEVKMPKQPREPKQAATRAVPLQVAPDEKIVAEPAANEEFVLPKHFDGELYLNYKHPDTGRISGKGMTWDEAKVLHDRKLLRYRNRRMQE